MTAPVHYVDEILYETTYRSACNTRDKLTDANTTQIDEHVTCAKCLTALGYEPAEPERLTAVESDPLKVAA